MTNSYVRLPNDDRFRVLFDEHGGRAIPMAAEIGCSMAAIRVRMHKLGLHAPSTKKGSVRDRIRLLEERLAELEERVAVLEARPIATFIQENHRRIADGGEGARHARRRSA